MFSILVSVNVHNILVINLVILCRYICISWPTHTTFGLRLCLFHISNKLRRIVNQYERLSRIYSRLKFLFPMVVARLAVDTTHKIDCWQAGVKLTDAPFLVYIKNFIGGKNFLDEDYYLSLGLFWKVMDGWREELDFDLRWDG